MTPSTVNKTCLALAKLDKDFAKAVKTYGQPQPRNRPAGFETLFNTIVSQQLSTDAASAIMGRARQILPEFNAASVLATDDKHLRAAGMSYRKIEYAKSLARAIESKTLDIDHLATMPDNQVIETITRLKGFGRRSAEIYLMFSLKREDIFPADDLALRIAIGKLKNLPEKPSAKQARQLVEHWSPYRTVGSLFLWHYYNGVKRSPNQ